MTAKILIVTGDAAESLEVLYPYQRLREEGYDVHIAAPARKQLRFVVHDFEPGFDTYTEKPGYTWPADLAFAEVDPGEYAALVIPGGRAPEYLRNDPELRKILKSFFDTDKPVAQICHGPLLTAAVDALRGRRVTVEEVAHDPPGVLVVPDELRGPPAGDDPYLERASQNSAGGGDHDSPGIGAH